MLRREIKFGLKREHIKKAIGRIRNLDHIRESETLSRNDLINLGNVRNDLIAALKEAGIHSKDFLRILKQ